MVLTCERRVSLQQTTHQPEIPKFSVDVQWEPYPRVKDIENEYDCNASSLRKCDINDPTALFGCKELSVRCHHFEKDTEYHSNGVKSVIPKNTSSTEGYALAITHLIDSCNPYHGDLILVSLDSESTEYMLICWCKHPGYIGNDNLLGACTDIRICNGQIDDLNKPLREINCICERRETSARYEDTGAPVCRQMLLHEANKLYDDWSSLVPWSSQRLAEISRFNVTIRDNVNSTVLLDPCKNALTDMSMEIPGATYNALYHTCAYTDYGIPVRIGALDEGSSTKDVIPLDGALPSKRYKSLRLIDHVAGKRKIINLHVELKLRYNTSMLAHFTLPETIALGESAQLFINTRNQMTGIQCENLWPYYNCYTKEYYNGRTFGIPQAGFKNCPNEFLWSRNDWIDAEGTVSLGIVPTKTGVIINHNTFSKIDKFQSYGLCLCHREEVACRNGALSFLTEQDHRRHKNVLTYV